MRILHTEPGIFSAYSQSSAAPNGEYLIFKKCSDIFYYFEPQNPSQNRDLKLHIEDALHKRDTIFDFAHLSDGRFLVLIQSSPENRVHLAEASLNLEERLVRVEQIAKENIEIRTKGGQTKLIIDEEGPVLVTFPNNFSDESLQSRTVQLFHIGHFMQSGQYQQKNVRIDRRIGVNELWCNPFISRNCLYFFNQLGNELLCISMVADTTNHTRFTARLLRTHASASEAYNGERPSARFFHRDTIVFHDFALVYFSQFVGGNGPLTSKRKEKSKKTNEDPVRIWKLWLNSLVWEPIKSNSDSLHLPFNRVSFKQSTQDATTAFLHGQCNRPACLLKQHFFELEIFGKSPTPDLPGPSNIAKRPTVLRRFVKFASGKSPKSEAPCMNKKSLLASSQAKSASCHSLLALANRNNPYSSASKRTSIVSEQAFLENAPSSSGSSQSLVNWNRQMSLQGETRLSEQLKYAKEMGYSDGEIWKALDLNNKNSQRAYEPFESISAMIDALSLAQKRQIHASTSSLATSNARFAGSTTTLPVYLDESKHGESSAKLPSWISSATLASPPTQTSAKTSGVNRSMSFNDTHGIRRSLAQSMVCLGTVGLQPTRQSNGGRSSIQRLIDTFENENRRHFEEYQRINNELRRKLENSLHQEETLLDVLRLRQEKIRQQEILLKNQDDLEKRLENANRRLQDMLKDLQLREAEISRQQGDFDTLQRRHEAESRKAEEVRQTLNSEIGRLVREQERHELIARQNEGLREELATKTAEIRRLREPNPELEQLNRRLESMRDDLDRVVAEKQELEENQGQGPVCGICMDQRREVIFMPCLHFTCCKRCANTLDHCSICRVRIMGKIEFFQ